MDANEYDPFDKGRFPVGVRTIEAVDPIRDRVFPIEIWSPEGPPGDRPLVVFSHHSGGHRRTATYLCTHLSSHGYVVAALDHSEVVAPELAYRADETGAERAARVDAWIANRVPDVRFLLDTVRDGVDPDRIGIVGYSFGGWTALAAPDVEPRIRAVVALAPAGSSIRRPGTIPATLDLGWTGDVPVLYLVAENDTLMPLEAAHELFDRTPVPRQMAILHRADHFHFADDVEEQHEAARATTFTGESAWIPAAMRPIAELCSGEEAHLFVRGLTLCHLDATLMRREEARHFLEAGMAAALTSRKIAASLR